MYRKVIVIGVSTKHSSMKDWLMYFEHFFSKCFKKLHLLLLDLKTLLQQLFKRQANSNGYLWAASQKECRNTKLVIPNA